MSVSVIYRWDAQQPVLQKFVEITNRTDQEWNRLLNVRLSHYDTDGVQVSDKPSGGTYSVPAPREFPLTGSTHVERGFPVYAAGEFFFALRIRRVRRKAPPAGFRCANTPELRWRRVRRSSVWRRCTAWPKPVQRSRLSWPMSEAACGAWSEATTSPTLSSSRSERGVRLLKFDNWGRWLIESLTKAGRIWISARHPQSNGQ